MDAFWTAEEISFRRKAHGYFLQEGTFSSAENPTGPAKVFRDLGFAPNRASLSEEFVMIDEAALYSPPLGQALLRWRSSGDCGNSIEGRLHHLASIAGTAAHVFEAGARLARDKGLFASSLMGFREIQESLARLASGVELLRLGACRVCRLLDQGRRDRGEAESISLSAQALALLHDVRSVAAGLLGAAWLTDNIPGDESPSPNERNVT